MFKADKIAGSQKKKANMPFIPKKENKVVKNEDFGLNKYMDSVPKPKNNEVHLLSYYHNKQPMSYQINSKATIPLTKKDFDTKVAVKEVKGLVIKKTKLNMKESNWLYICSMNVEEEKEKMN